MREKPANERAVSNLIGFIYEIKQAASSTSEDEFDVQYFTNFHNVAKRSFSDLKALKIVTKQGNKLTFNSKQDLRIIALKVLDYRLKKTKKTVHFPLPGLGAIADSLKEITEKLIYLSVQHERAFKSTKNSLNEGAEVSTNLFTEEQQRHKDRIYIAGQIANGLYSDPTLTGDFNNINYCVIRATDDLLDKLYPKSTKE
jgi:hypothetical protein